MKKIICAFICSVAITLGCFGNTAAYSAKSYLLMNGDTGETLCGENSDARLPMASTTKIMTALLFCENFPNLEAVLTVPKEAVGTEGTSMYLVSGENVTARAILYGMLLNSGNDAANTAAIAVSGDISAFVELMNKKAEELKLKNTHFATPSGLDGDGHYTTAYDLAVLTRAALSNKAFSDACKTEKITLSYGEPAKKHTFVNHNRLLRLYDDFVGVKTGYTKAAGRCLVSAAKKNGMYLICVTLNDRNDWADHRALIDKGYGILSGKQKYISERTVKIPIASGNTASLKIPQINYYTASENNTVKVVYPAIVYAPITKGEDMGCAYYYCDYKCIKQFKIKACCDIKEKKYSTLEKILCVAKEMISRV